MARDLHWHDRCDRMVLCDHRQCRCAERYGRLWRRSDQDSGWRLSSHDDRRAVTERDIIAAFGQRFGFSMLIIVFTIGTMIAVTSTNITTLTIGRMIRAFARGDSAARSGHSLRRVQAGPTRHGMGIFRMAIMLAPGLGHAVGGIAIDHLSWRHLLIPCACLVGFVLGNLREADDQKTRRSISSPLAS